MATPASAIAQNLSPSTVQFSDCVFDMSARRLHRCGRQLSLQPKMFELLEILIERAPAVVSNEELDEILWPKVFVCRTSLARLVSELRALLGDSARDARIIRTVYKRGYAFCAVPHETHESANASTITMVWRDRHLMLIDGVYILGRDLQCDFAIDAATVSRRHARLVVQRGRVTIEDMASTNGTHVNGQEIRESTPLVDGAEISLGNEPLVLRVPDPAAITIVGRPAKPNQSR